jgi:hypothetical protein
MSVRALLRLFTIGSFSLLWISFLSAVQQQEVTRREISRTSEKQITVSVDASFGTVIILKGDRNKVIVAEYSREQDDRRELEMFYDIADGLGDLEINLTDHRNHKDRRNSSISWEEMKDERDNGNERRLTARLTDAVPLSLKIGLGAGKGKFDLSGLKLSSLKVSAGASSAELQCNEPNAISCENVTIESGVSKFSAHSLVNLNFQKLKFSGGVGSYTLDFAGKLQQKAYADVEVGLGSIVVYVPKNMPTKVLTDESWFSSVDVDDCFEKTRKGTYETDGFGRSDRTLTIKIGSGLGSIKVRCR